MKHCHKLGIKLQQKTTIYKKIFYHVLFKSRLMIQIFGTLNSDFYLFLKPLNLNLAVEVEFKKCRQSQKS